VEAVVLMSERKRRAERAGGRRVVNLRFGRAEEG
jgi:hypothetical protein